MFIKARKNWLSSCCVCGCVCVCVSGSQGTRTIVTWQISFDFTLSPSVTNHLVSWKLVCVLIASSLTNKQTCRCCNPRLSPRPSILISALHPQVLHQLNLCVSAIAACICVCVCMCVCGRAGWWWWSEEVRDGEVLGSQICGRGENSVQLNRGGSSSSNADSKSSDGRAGVSAGLIQTSVKGPFLHSIRCLTTGGGQ